MPSADPIRRAAVITHGRREAIGAALDRLRAVAEEAGVGLALAEGEAEKHGLGSGEAGAGIAEAEIAIVLGGDGTMLRALGRFLGTGVPVVGVNFGHVGFLTSIGPAELEAGLRRVFAGGYRVIELATLELDLDGGRETAVNDVVAASSTLGRMVELDWAVGDEDLGRLACDGVICSTPSGSTGYNLSNGGPVLVWGLDAMAVTFIAPHSLHARPLVVGRGRELVVTNRSADVPVSVLVDGRPVAQLRRGESFPVRLGRERSLLATLPEATFFRRYRETFAS